MCSYCPRSITQFYGAEQLDLLLPSAAQRNYHSTCSRPPVKDTHRRWHQHLHRVEDSTNSGAGQPCRHLLLCATEACLPRYSVVFAGQEPRWTLGCFRSVMSAGQTGEEVGALGSGNARSAGTAEPVERSLKQRRLPGGQAEKTYNFPVLAGVPSFARSFLEAYAPQLV